MDVRGANSSFSRHFHDVELEWEFSRIKGMDDYNTDISISFGDILLLGGVNFEFCLYYHVIESLRDMD